MNAERLALIARSIVTDMDESRIEHHLDVLINSLNTQISQPNEQNEKAVSDNLNALNIAIDNSKFSQFPKTWRPALEELGVYEFLGDQLKIAVAKSFDTHKAIRVEVRDELAKTRATLAEYKKAFTNINQGFSYLKISEEGPKPGEAELSILMPRAAINSELKKFGDEIQVFVKGMNFFSELATGSRETPRIKQLSTTDPILLLFINPATLFLWLKVVEKILDIRIKTYKLRQLKTQAEEAEAGRAAIEAIKKEIASKVDEGLKLIKDELFKEFKVKSDRQGPLEKEAELVLENLAERIDNGYEIDGDIGEMPPEKGEDGQEKPARGAEYVERIKRVAATIRYLDAPAEPVLQLDKPAPGKPAAKDEKKPDKDGKK